MSVLQARVCSQEKRSSLPKESALHAHEKRKSCRDRAATQHWVRAVESLLPSMLGSRARLMPPPPTGSSSGEGAVPAGGGGEEADGLCMGCCAVRRDRRGGGRLGALRCSRSFACMTRASDRAVDMTLHAVASAATCEGWCFSSGRVLTRSGKPTVLCHTCFTHRLQAQAGGPPA